MSNETPASCSERCFVRRQPQPLAARPGRDRVEPQPRWTRPVKNTPEITSTAPHSETSRTTSLYVLTSTAGRVYVIGTTLCFYRRRTWPRRGRPGDEHAPRASSVGDYYRGSAPEHLVISRQRVDRALGGVMDAILCGKKNGIAPSDIDLSREELRGGGPGAFPCATLVTKGPQITGLSCGGPRLVMFTDDRFHPGRDAMGTRRDPPTVRPD